MNLWVSPRSGFDLGFDSFDWVRSGRGGRFPTTRRQRLRWTVEAVAARRDDGAKEAAGRLLRRIDGDDDDRPFFAFVNLLECHSPYLPPKPWNDLSPRRRLRAGETARRYQTYEAFARVCLTDAEIPERELADMRYLYSRAVSSMDSWLAGVLEALEHRGLLDDTVVVVLSDHGENFGEGGLVNHMFSLDDRLLRVPLVLFGPGVERWSGHAQPVSLADLPAMLAEVVGLQHHPWTAGEAGRDGVTVAQFDPPATADDPAARDIERRWSLDEASFARLTSPLTSATDGRLKLLRRPAGELLVDLEGDPLELDPRPAPIADDRLTHLRSALDRAAAVEAPEIRETVDEPGLSDAERVELEEQMRLLGYL